jgi:hypothetical protein
MRHVRQRDLEFFGFVVATVATRPITAGEDGDPFVVGSEPLG